MSRTAIVALTRVVGLAAGILPGGQLMPRPRRRRLRRRPRTARLPPHSDLRREGHVSLRVEDRRQPLEPPLLVQIGSDRAVVTFDRNTHKMLKYDLDGRLLYALAPSRISPAHCGACTA
jgi:hypothetical protein